MSKNILVNFPCKTYIRKYICSIYGDPVVAALRNPLGAFINTSLEKNLYLDRKLSDSFIHKYYKDKLPVSLNRWQFSHVGFDVPPAKAHLLNMFMEDLFETHLFFWCDAGVQNGRERKRCIEQFATLHNIETEIDIGFDSLKKLDYRAREKRQKVDIPMNTLRSMEYRMHKEVEPRRNNKALQFSLFE